MSSFCHNCGALQGPLKPSTSVGDLTITVYGECHWNGKQVPLTLTEAQVIWALVAKPGTPLKKEALENLLDSKAATTGTNTICVLISRIRAKFRKVDPGFDRLKTWWGYGYLWEARPTGLRRATD